MSEPRLPLAIVITSFDSGGTERQMTELVSRLDRRCFDLHVACFRREGPLLQAVERAVPSLTVFPLSSFRSPSTWVQAVRFARWCRRRRIAAVHACDLYANVFALPAAALARVPVRIGSRRGIVSPTGAPGLLRLQALAYRCATAVAANSAAAARVVAEEGVAPSKIAVIPNGIDLRRFAPRAGSGVRRVITTVANLRRGKGHDVLLQSARTVLASRPDVTFQLAGDGPLRPALEAQARALGIDSRVRFLGHCDDVTKVLRESDLFVLPSMMEAFPNAVMEAMAAGLPVVATGVGGIPELVDDGRSGLLVPPGDPAALAAAIERLLSDPLLTDGLAAAARAAIESRYSFARMVSAFEALYLGELSNTLPIDAAREPWVNVFPRV